MGVRVYFHADGITVWAHALAVGQQLYAIKDVLSARCERLRIKWLWPLPVDSFALVLTMADGRAVRAVKKRNAYFIFQLVNAIHAALEDNRQGAPATAKAAS